MNAETNNNQNTPSKGARRLAFALNIGELLCGIAGVYAFCNDLSIYHIFGTAILIFRILEIMLGHQITMSLVACVVGALCVGNIWDGICIGLAFEAIFSIILAYILVVFMRMRGPVVIKQQQSQDSEESVPTENEEDVEIDEEE